MSQEKVERNKELKSNRKKINQQKKFRSRLYAVIAGLICVVFVVWIGYSIYDSAASAGADADSATPISVDAITDYISELTSESE